MWTKRNYWTVLCKRSVQPKSFIPSKIRPVQCKRSLNLILSARLVSTSLQYSSKILKHLCAFSLPQCWFGYYIRLSALKYALLNIGEGEGHIWVRTKVWRVNERNLKKIQDKCLLFQRFVTSIVGLVSSWHMLEEGLFGARQKDRHCTFWWRDGLPFAGIVKLAWFSVYHFVVMRCL